MKRMNTLILFNTVTHRLPSTMNSVRRQDANIDSALNPTFPSNRDDIKYVYLII